MKKERLDHHALIHRLKFDTVIEPQMNADERRLPGSGKKNLRQSASSAVKLSGAEAELAELQSRLDPLEKEINQLGRQSWVSKEQVAANNYDLSASRYRQVEQEEVFSEEPAVTLERMRQLEQVAESDVAGLEKMLANVRTER